MTVAETAAAVTITFYGLQESKAQRQTPPYRSRPQWREPSMQTRSSNLSIVQISVWKDWAILAPHIFPPIPHRCRRQRQNSSIAAYVAGVCEWRMALLQKTELPLWDVRAATDASEATGPPPHSISHHHSLGPKTRFLSKPQNIEDRVSLGDLFPWQLCSKPGSACEQIPVSHNRTRIQQIVLFFPVCEKTVACDSVSSRARFNVYITSQFSCETQKSYHIQNVSKYLLFSSGICGHARQKWCLNVDWVKG